MVTCSVPDCGRPVRTNGLCYRHYMKMWRYGTPTPTHPPRSAYLLGKRFDELVVLSRHDGKWLCKCDCGNFTWRGSSTELKRGERHSCGATVHRRARDPNYSVAHDWVAAERGTARSHQCIDCSGRAAQWSYDHNDPDERIEQNPKDTAFKLPFSLKPEHYSPRCVRCHKIFDLSR